MRVVVVIPAHNEQALIGRCLQALSAQRAAPSLEVILVLDRCSDLTEQRAAAFRGALELTIVASSEAGVGFARKLGMDLACVRLEAEGLICTTDADTVVAQDWVAVQCALARAGADAIGGLIELDPGEEKLLPRDAVHEREQRASERLEQVRARGSAALCDHHHFSGASLAVTAGAYRLVGGLQPHAALEDEAFGRRLTAHGIPIVRSGAVRVRTSARTEGRAPRGLARDLSLSTWRSRRTWDGGAFNVAELVSRRRHSVSVIVPTREVATTIGRVVSRIGRLRHAGLVDEILVVDAASSDGTADVAQEAGARVLQECAILPEFGSSRGKGDAMWRGIAASFGELLVFVDGDTEEFEESFVVGLLGPLLSDPGVSFVKGAFRRPFRIGDAKLAGEGGRVTELVARPLLNLYWPHLAGFEQPLAGELAAHRSLLEALPFPVGYGIEIAMLIDAAAVAGIDALAQVDLGERQNRHQSLRDLSAMAYAVLVAATDRLAAPAATPGPLLLPPLESGRPMEPRAVAIEERPPLADLGRPPISDRRSKVLA